MTKKKSTRFVLPDDELAATAGAWAYSGQDMFGVQHYQQTGCGGFGYGRGYAGAACMGGAYAGGYGAGCNPGWSASGSFSTGASVGGGGGGFGLNLGIGLPGLSAGLHLGF